MLCITLLTPKTLRLELFIHSANLYLVLRMPALGAEVLRVPAQWVEAENKLVSAALMEIRHSWESRVQPSLATLAGGT